MMYYKHRSKDKINSKGFPQTIPSQSIKYFFIINYFYLYSRYFPHPLFQKFFNPFTFSFAYEAALPFPALGIPRSLGHQVRIKQILSHKGKTNQLSG